MKFPFEIRQQEDIDAVTAFIESLLKITPPPTETERSSILEKVNRGLKYLGLDQVYDHPTAMVLTRHTKYIEDTDDEKWEMVITGLKSSLEKLKSISENTGAQEK